MYNNFTAVFALLLTCLWLLTGFLLPDRVQTMDRSRSRTSQAASRAENSCDHCESVRRNLGPRDIFQCFHCEGSGEADPPAEEEVEQAPKSTVRKIFMDVMGRSSGSQQDPRDGVPLASAREEALLTFRSGTKAAEYEKLARGPIPHASTGLRKVRPLLVHYCGYKS